MSVQYLSDPKKWKALEAAYIDVRKKEERIYSDEQLLKLPEIDKNHRHFKEWMYRRDSLQNLLAYLSKKPFKKLMDLGCGNGWMSNSLSRNGFEVVGVDVNLTELEQIGRAHV